MACFYHNKVQIHVLSNILIVFFVICVITMLLYSLHHCIMFTLVTVCVVFVCGILLGIKMKLKEGLYLCNLTKHTYHWLPFISVSMYMFFLLTGQRPNEYILVDTETRDLYEERTKQF